MTEPVLRPGIRIDRPTDVWHERDRKLYPQVPPRCEAWGGEPGQIYTMFCDRLVHDDGRHWSQSSGWWRYNDGLPDVAAPSPTAAGTETGSPGRLATGEAAAEEPSREGAQGGASD